MPTLSNTMAPASTRPNNQQPRNYKPMTPEPNNTTPAPTSATTPQTAEPPTLPTGETPSTATTEHTPTPSTDSASTPRQSMMSSEGVQSPKPDTEDQTAEESTAQLDEAPMTDEDRKRRTEIEIAIHAANINSLCEAELLEEIRANRLYRDTHLDFSSYCNEVFGFTEARATQLIKAATEFRDLSRRLPLDTIPKTECGLREIRKVPAVHKQTVLQKAYEYSGSRPPTAKAIEKAWKELHGPISEQAASTTGPKADQILKTLDQLNTSLETINHNKLTFEQLKALRAKLARLASMEGRLPTFTELEIGTAA